MDIRIKKIGDLDTGRSGFIWALCSKEHQVLYSHVCADSVFAKTEKLYFNNLLGVARPDDYIPESRRAIESINMNYAAICIGMPFGVDLNNSGELEGTGLHTRVCEIGGLSKNGGRRFLWQALASGEKRIGLSFQPVDREIDAFSDFFMVRAAFATAIQKNFQVD